MTKKKTVILAECTGGLSTRWGNDKAGFKQFNLSDESHPDNMKYTPWVKLIHNAAGNITFEIDLNTPKVAYRINVSNHYIYEMMKYHLAVRPIRLHNGDEHKLRLHEKIRRVPYYDLDNIPVAIIAEKYEDACSHLGNLITYSTGKQKKAAEYQLQRMEMNHHKIKLIEVIEYSLNMGPTPFKSKYV